MTQNPGGTAPVNELTYEQARDELVALVARIESGTVPLEESMLLWERGEELAAHCQAKLDAAQETLDRTGQAPGSPATDGPGTSGVDDEGEGEDEDEDEADQAATPDSP